MRKNVLIKYVFLSSIIICSVYPTFSQRRDTLYLNASWQICEKPFASYYRFGKIMIDSFWYYSGRVQDFYVNDTMQMDGNYSSIGEKEGKFYFFYRDGTLRANGSYSNNLRTGTWEYYYRSGSLQMRVNYPGDETKFIVLDYIDSTGKVLTKDGTGSFEVPVTSSTGIGNLRLEGEFKNGKRTGNWRFYIGNYFDIDKKRVLFLKETYENDEFKKGFLYNGYSGSVYETYKKPRNLYIIPEYEKFRTTEYFTKDRTSFRNSNDDQDLLNYLVKRQAPSFDVEGESFEESFVGLLKTLNTPSVLRFFNNKQKIYNGEVLINLSDSGDIEEIQITGNLTEKEKEYMLFFLKKFKNIHEIIIENVGVDAYHKIYFYTVVFSEVIPKRYLDNFPETQFLFAVMPYDKLKEAVKEAMKRKGKKEKKD